MPYAKRWGLNTATQFHIRIAKYGLMKQSGIEPKMTQRIITSRINLPRLQNCRFFVQTICIFRKRNRGTRRLADPEEFSMELQSKLRDGPLVPKSEPS